MALTVEAGKRKWEKNFPAWVEKCSSVHGGKYVYPSDERVKDENGRWKVRITCPEHGDFWQIPEKHAFGQGCSKCSGHGTDKRAELARMFPGFVWPSDLKVVNTKTPFVLNCHEHGEFSVTFNQAQTRHKAGNGVCPKCNKASAGVLRRRAVAHWLSDIERAYGGRLKLDVDTIGLANQKARFVCVEHGEFWSILQDVKGGHGCPTCGAGRRVESIRSSLDEFVSAARAVHGDRYGYGEVEYKDTKTEVAIVCPDHGVFLQRPNNHTNGQGCPACANGTSAGELSVREWLEGSGVKVFARDRSVLEGKEIDLYLPEHNVGIEYCGLYWHGEHHKGVEYHQKKWRQARDRGVKLVTVFEDEWLDQESRVRVMFRILSMIGASTVRMARKTRCERISWGEAKWFLDTHHMQGAGVPSSTCYGLFDGGELVAVTTWCRSRFDKQAAWELLRFSCANSDRVVGGLGKMFEAFKRDVDAASVVTYADLRWGDGSGYEKVGFVRCGSTKPGYFWCKGVSRFSRHDFQKHKLAATLRNYDPELSEADNCHMNGYWRIYDCGHSRWLWTR